MLACLLLDNAHMGTVGAMLGSADFYDPRHRALWSTMARLIGAGRVADVITVVEAGEHDAAYCDALAMSIASTRHASAYAAVVREKALRRTIMAIGADLADLALHGTTEAGDAATLIERTVSKLMALQAGTADHQPQVMSDLLPTFIDRLEARASGTNDAMPTGLRDIDRLLSGGLRRGELIVIGARPSMGKSALSLTIARSMAAQASVLVCSMEDSQHMLVSRQVAAAGRVNLADIRSPERAPQSMWTGVADAVELLRPLALHIDDQPSLSLRDVRRKIAQTRMKAGALDIVVVDYLQLMQGDGDNRHQVLGAIAAGLKSTAKEYGCAVILLSQLNREADKTDSPPRLDHLRESGGIEEAADIVGLLWRESRRKPKPDNKHSAQLEFAKHKNGATDTVRLWFDGATQRFCDWTDEGHSHAH